MKLFSIPEAARVLRINVKTVRKHVKDGRLEAIQTPVGIRISEETLRAYSPMGQLFDDNVDHDAPVETRPDQTTSDQIEPGWTSVDQARPDHHGPTQTSKDQGQYVPLQAHLAALEFAERRILEERSRSVQCDDQVASVTLALEQAQRGRLNLEMQLKQYQLVLGEQAESLSEERARRLSVESEVDRARQELEEENARKLQEFEAERAQLVERLKLSESRVDWLEKRVPRWVRALFRAG